MQACPQGKLHIQSRQQGKRSSLVSLRKPQAWLQHQRKRRRWPRPWRQQRQQQARKSSTHLNQRSSWSNLPHSPRSSLLAPSGAGPPAPPSTQPAGQAASGMG